MYDSISQFFRETHDLVIGEKMVEWIVDSVKAATTSGKEVMLSIKGRNLYSGEPKELSISSEGLSLYWKSSCIVNRRNKHCLEIESHFAINPNLSNIF